MIESNKKLIATLYQEFWNTLPNEIFHREAKVFEQAGLATTILGPRRAGKTYLLFQKIKDLTEGKTPKETILYINFEDDRIGSIDGTRLGKLVDAFYELFPANFDRKVYLFFDEIQNVDYWSKPIRRFLDKLNCQVYLTGSSSKLLSREMATSLRGRTLSVTLFPFSFLETQKFTGALAIKMPSQKELALGNKNLLHFLETGGFPMVLNAKPLIQKIIQKEYFDLIIYKDVIERFEIQNISALNYIANFGLRNYGRLFSGMKLYNDLKSQGFSISKDKLFDYLDHLNEAYLLFYVPIYTESVRKRNSNPKKIFSIDTGLARSFEFNSEQDLGRKFENLIFLDLLRQQYEVFYFITKDGNEVDFVIKKEGKKTQLLQVCWNVSDLKTLDREQKALSLAQKELGLKGQLVTPDEYLSRIQFFGF